MNKFLVTIKQTKFRHVKNRIPFTATNNNEKIYAFNK